MFPINALLSNEHDFNDDPHFLRYAHVAFRKLLKAENRQINIPFYESALEYDITELYGDDSVVVILCNENTDKLEEFNFENYFPHLYKLGIFSYDLSKCRKSEKYAVNDQSYELLESITKNKILVLETMSNDLKQDSYIRRLFIELLKNENHPLVRFHLLYQVIELLIEKIFNNEIKKIFKELETAKKDLYRIREKFTDLSKEIGRLNKLFGDYTGEVTNKKQLEIYCKQLIEIVDGEWQEKDKTTGTLLYRVRNILFHDFRNVPPDEMEILININQYFELTIIDIIQSYKEVDIR